MNTDKFKKWFKSQDNECLDTIFNILKKEYTVRGLDISKNRGFYKSSEGLKEMKESVKERFTYEDDGGSGQWC